MFPKQGEPRRRQQRSFAASLLLLSEGFLPAWLCGCGHGLEFPSLRNHFALSCPAFVPFLEGGGGPRASGRARPGLQASLRCTLGQFPPLVGIAQREGLFLVLFLY